jgi:hypothetical protein
MFLPSPSSKVSSESEAESDTLWKLGSIVVHWDTFKEESYCRKIHFPVTSTTSKSTSSGAETNSLFEELLKTCTFTTFRRKNEDVLNETYGKAGQLGSG